LVPPTSSARDFNLGVTALRGGIHHCNDSFYVQSKDGPLWSANYHDGNSPALQVLLVSNVFVGRNKHIEPRFFSWVQQSAVRESIPALRRSGSDIVPFEKWPDRHRGGLIEKDPHH